MTSREKLHGALVLTGIVLSVVVAAGRFAVTPSSGQTLREQSAVDLVVPAGGVTMELRRQVSSERDDAPLGSRWKMTLGGLGEPIPLDGRPFPVSHEGLFRDVVDGRHRIVSRSDQRGHTIAIAYDGSGRVSRVTAPGNVTLTFATDAAGRVTSVSGPGGAVSYTYEGSDLASTQRDGEPPVRYEYAADGTPRIVQDPGAAPRTAPQGSSAPRASGGTGGGDYRRDAYGEIARIQALIDGPQPTSLRAVAKLAVETEAAAGRKLTTLTRLTTDFWTAPGRDLQTFDSLQSTSVPESFSAMCESVAHIHGRLVSLDTDIKERRTEIEQRLTAAAAGAAACRTQADANKIRENYNAAERLHSGLDGLVQLVGQTARNLPAPDSPFAKYHTALQNGKQKLSAGMRTLEEAATAVTKDVTTARRLLEAFRTARGRIDGEITAAKRRFAVPPSNVTGDRLPAEIAAAFDAVRRNLQRVSEPAVGSLQFTQSVQTAIDNVDGVRLAVVNLQGVLNRSDCEVPVMSADEMGSLLSELDANVKAARASFRAAAHLPRNADECAPSGGTATTTGSTAAGKSRFVGTFNSVWGNGHVEPPWTRAVVFIELTADGRYLVEPAIPCRPPTGQTGRPVPGAGGDSPIQATEVSKAPLTLKVTCESPQRAIRTITLKLEGDVLTYEETASDGGRASFKGTRTR